MKLNQRPSPLVRAAVTCMLLGGLALSCGDDDAASTDSTTAATASATTEPATTTVTTAPMSSSSAPASSPTSTGDVCADREALQTSVDALTDVNLVSEGTNGVTAAVNDVKDALAALRSSAGAELRPQVDAVQDALAEVETAVASLGSGGAAAAVTAVASLATSARTLLDSLDNGACGESTTSTT